ncbi:hypothetical protein [Streptacidiphilus sp. PAMC 29251]
MLINNLVSVNLNRARRLEGWTQEEAARRLQEVSGKPWTASSLGAAERSVKTGRTREFNANELINFCITFRQPLAFFFMPPSTSSDIDFKFVLHGKFVEGASVVQISEYDLLAATVPLHHSSLVVDDVQAILAKRDQTWDPSTGKIGWLRPEEHWAGADGDEPGQNAPYSDSLIAMAAEWGVDPGYLVKNMTPEVMKKYVEDNADFIAENLILQILKSNSKPTDTSGGDGLTPPPF